MDMASAMVDGSFARSYLPTPVASAASISSAVCSLLMNARATCMPRTGSTSCVEMYEVLPLAWSVYSPAPMTVARMPSAGITNMPERSVCWQRSRTFLPSHGPTSPYDSLVRSYTYSETPPEKTTWSTSSSESMSRLSVSRSESVSGSISPPLMASKRMSVIFAANSSRFSSVSFSPTSTVWPSEPRMVRAGCSTREMVMSSS